MKLRSSLLLVFAVAALWLMNSCTKKYVCHCNIQYTGAPGLPDSSYVEYDITDTKDGATSKCKGESGTFDNNGIHTVESCILN